MSVFVHTYILRIRIYRLWIYREKRYGFCTADTLSRSERERDDFSIKNIIITINESHFYFVFSFVSIPYNIV